MADLWMQTMKLHSCSARCLGKAIPTGSVEYPAIIHDPLRVIYSPAVVKRPDLLVRQTSPVTIQVFGCGIAVVEQKGGENVNWYPIENFYCSAGIVPDKGGKTRSVVFKGLMDKCKYPGQPIFAMVVRQPGSDGRRVLTCHAFLMDNNIETQKLVNATKQAYQNKSGWSASGNDKEFLNAKLSYTMQKLEKNQENNIDDLKVLTERRDKQLSQKPKGIDLKTHPEIKQNHRSQTMTTQRSLLPTQSMVVRQPQVRSMKVRSPPATPPTPRFVATPLPLSVPVATPSAILAPQSMRLPIERAKSLYEGFTTETLNNQSVKVSSEINYRNASLVGSDARHGNSGTAADIRSSSCDFQSTHRRNWPAEAPRGHRILASSEPQELVNGFGNSPAPQAVFQPDMNEGAGTTLMDKKRNHSKYHRPSKKMMEKYSHHNDGQRMPYNGPQQEGLADTDSDYSITRVPNQPAMMEMNGFLSGHKQADQQL